MRGCKTEAMRIYTTRCSVDSSSRDLNSHDGMDVLGTVS